IFDRLEGLPIAMRWTFIANLSISADCTLDSGTMALPNLRRIFSSFRTPEEEAQISRSAFFKFSGYILTCAFITWVAAKQGAHLRLGPSSAV
ncbi:hypothetical protein EDD11_009605, partial [Mortierella claussenii]